jgi:hypothetical protein
MGFPTTEEIAGLTELSCQSNAVCAVAYIAHVYGAAPKSARRPVKRAHIGAVPIRKTHSLLSRPAATASTTKIRLAVNIQSQALAVKQITEAPMR